MTRLQPTDVAKTTRQSGPSRSDHKRRREGTEAPACGQWGPAHVAVGLEADCLSVRCPEALAPPSTATPGKELG